MIMYKQLKDIDGNILNMVVRLSDLAYIPFSTDNTDYQAYLKWLEAGNTPQPADEVTK